MVLRFEHSENETKDTVLYLFSFYFISFLLRHGRTQGVSFKVNMR